VYPLNLLYKKELWENNLSEDQQIDKHIVEYGKSLNETIPQEVRRKILDYVANVKGVTPSER